MKKLFTLALMALMGVSAWADTWEKATSIAVGDEVVLAYEDDNITKELTGISGNSTKIGTATAYTTTPACTYPLTVEAGSATGSFAFKTNDNKYLYWGSGNSLNVNATLNENTSWTVSFTDGAATIINVKDNTRYLQFNANNNQHRFACYTNTQKSPIFYKKQSGSDNRTATSIEFSGNYATKFTYGANGESCALPSATVKAGETPIDAIVTWEVTKGADFVVGDEEPVIEGNAVKPSNHSYGKLTLKASFAGDTQNKPSSKSYDLMVYKGYMKISEILTDFQKENTRFTSTGIPVSYWCMADETTAGTATVTYVNGSNTYINDGTNDLLLYGSDLGLTKGDVISCDKGNDQGFDGIYGTMKQFSGLLEFAISAADMKFTIKSQGATVTPKTIDVADLGAIANMNAYLKIENAEYVSADNKNLTFKVGEASFIVRQNWTNVSIDGLEATAKYTLEGMGAVYKTSTATTYQLYLTSWTKTGEPTAINEVKANILQNGAVYNVAGQKVNAGYKGLVIKNGKKVVNK